MHYCFIPKLEHRFSSFLTDIDNIRCGCDALSQQSVMSMILVYIVRAHLRRGWRQRTLMRAYKKSYHVSHGSIFSVYVYDTSNHNSYWYILSSCDK